MLHDPLVRPPLLPSVTAVVAEAPGAVHQHLLGQNLQGTCLEDESEQVTIRQTGLGSPAPPGQLRDEGPKQAGVEGGGGQDLQRMDSYVRTLGESRA